MYIVQFKDTIVRSRFYAQYNECTLYSDKTVAVHMPAAVFNFFWRSAYFAKVPDDHQTLNEPTGKKKKSPAKFRGILFRLVRASAGEFWSKTI